MGQLMVDKRELASQLEQARVALSKNEERHASTVALESWDVQRMQKLGLVDPVHDIIADLRKHSELIPFDGSMGGKMDFYIEDRIWILTNKWVLAYFEDGHNSGQLLLEYSISKKGEINWKRLSAHLN